MSDGACPTPERRQVSIAEIERRGDLAGSANRLSIADHVDWGKALLHDGDIGSARVLLQSAFIRQGFSWQHQVSRRSILRDIGAPDREALRPTSRRPGINTVGLAIEELRGFSRAFAAPIAAGLLHRPTREHAPPGLHPTAIKARAAALPSDRPVSGLIDELFGWLSFAGGDAAADQGAALAMDLLRGSDGDSGDAPIADLAGAAADVVASAIALGELCSFLRCSADLLQEPLGSLSMFRTAAAFDGAGLGPWFGNVAQIVRRSADLFELAAIAEDSAHAAGHSVGEEAWIVLLSRQVGQNLWAELIDDLGDRDAALALDLLLDRELARPSGEIDQPRIMRLRDAALDNLRYDLAASAQRALARLNPDSMLELRILGSIDASAGYVAAADQSLSISLAADPTNMDLQREVIANRARKYAPFALTKGYGSPRDRELQRLHRRMSA